MIKKLLPFIIIIVVVAAAYLFYIKYKDRVQTPATSNQATLAPMSQYVNNSNESWSEPKEATEQTMYGKLAGEEISTLVTSDQAMVEPFENQTTLKSEGFETDNNLAAGGAGSQINGYKRSVNGKSQVLLYSYQTEPTSTNPNEPLQFNCPCKVNLKVFLSEPFDENK